MKKLVGSLLLGVILVVLTACGGGTPADKEAQRTPYADHIDAMQRAVDQFQQDTGGLLPIKTKENEKDLFIKYPIDFSKIVPKYTDQIPSNAYEKGGLFQYVIYNVEEQPQVKLVDLRSAERIREIHLRKTISGRLPFAEEITPFVYTIEFKEMGFKEPVTIPSPYSNENLPVVVAGDGKYYIDYTFDINKALQSYEGTVDPTQDLRFLLADQSYILPAYSLPYYLNEQGEPEMRYEVKQSK